MTVRPLWLAVAAIVVGALGLLTVYAMCRAAGKSDRVSEDATARCPGCGHDYVGAEHCGSPLAAAGPHLSACWCSNAWHMAPTGLVVQPTKEELDRLWENVAEAIRQEREK